MMLEAKNYVLDKLLEEKKELIQSLVDCKTEKEFIKILLQKIDKLEDKLYSAKDLVDYKEWSKQGPKTLTLYIDAMAAAYSQNCNINPLKVRLNCGVFDDSKGIYYWFSERDGTEKVIENVTV